MGGNGNLGKGVVGNSSTYSSSERNTLLHSWQMSKVSICQDNTDIIIILSFGEACANQANVISRE